MRPFAKFIVFWVLMWPVIFLPLLIDNPSWRLIWIGFLAVVGLGRIGVLGARRQDRDAARETEREREGRRQRQARSAAIIEAVHERQRQRHADDVAGFVWGDAVRS